MGSHRRFAFLVSGPLDILALSLHPACLSLGSLYRNYIRDKGASALAAVLKETNITELEYAVAQSVRLHVSAH